MNKKKFIFIILCAIYLLLNFDLSIQAATSNENIIYLTDGTSIETILTETSVCPNARNTLYSKQATKTVNISKNGTIFASYTLTATFTYNGTTSSCTAVSCNTSVSDSSWKFTTKTVSKSSNKAIGRYTAKKYLLGIAIQTIEDTVTITCDKNGLIS